jgi:cobalt-zinc-cadmium efflux system outer membrane protein
VATTLAALGGLFAVESSAQSTGQRTETTPPLTLAAAVARALRANPDLRVSRATIDSAHAETDIARARPNPVVAAVPNTPFQYSATLPVDVGPQRVSRTRVADLGLAAATADSRESERQVALAVARLFYDVLLADARQRIVTDRLEVMRQLVFADSARVRAGDLPERALTRSQVEQLRAEADLGRASLDAITIRLSLQAFLGDSAPDGALQLDGDLHYVDAPLDGMLDGGGATIADGVARRPDVAAARTREAQSAAVERYAASLRLPVPQLSYVQQLTAPFESGRYYALGIGVELPLFNGYGAQRRRAAAGRSAALAARDRAEAQAHREISVALATYRAQYTLVRRYGAGITGKVEQNVEATRYAYARGAASLLEVLDALRAQHDVLTDYYTLLHDYWISMYSLRSALALAP